jgi:hypothetical protein
MGLLSTIFSGGVANLFKAIMDEIKLSPEKRADFEMQMAQLQMQAAQADKDYEAKLNQIASDNIKTDSSSSDTFVRRARPFFLWIMALAIGWNLLVSPLVNLATGRGLTALLIPDAYLDLYKVAFLGYVTARSVEKVTGKD